jgi:hypothetical protein
MTVAFRLLCLCVFLFIALKASGDETLEPWHPEFARAHFEKAGIEPRSSSTQRTESNADFDIRRACAEALIQKDNDRIRQYCDPQSRLAPITAGQGRSASEVTEVNSTSGGGSGSTATSTNTATSGGTTSGSTSSSSSDCVVTTWNTCSDSAPETTSDPTPSPPPTNCGGRSLYTQSDVDAFPAYCEYVDGNLTLWGSGNSSDPITDLAPLSGVREIYGNLSIGNNYELRAIDSLGQLKHVSGGIEIYDNPKLIDVQGLKGISYTGGGLLIWSNATLESLDGLQNITALGNSAVLHITYNPNLTDLNYFDGLKENGNHVPWVVSITNNDSLKTLTGLEWVSRIDTALYIRNNPNLTDVGALARTTSVGASRNNTGTPEFVVNGNGQLNDCAGLANALGWPEVSSDLWTVIVENNGASSSCSSATGILNSVSGPSTPTLKNYRAENGRLSLEFTDSTSDPLYPVSGYSLICDTSSSANDTAKTELPDKQLVNRYLTLSPRGLPQASFNPSLGTYSFKLLDLALDVSHDFPEQLIVDLTFPNGERVNLHNQEESGNADVVAQYPRDLATDESEAWNSAQQTSLEGAFKLSLLDDVGPINGISREGTLNQWDLIAQQIILNLYGIESSSVVALDQLVNGNYYNCAVSPSTYLGPQESSTLRFSFTQKLVPPAAPTVAETQPDIDSAIVVVSPYYPEGEEVSRHQVTCKGDDQGDTVVAESADASVNIEGLEGGSTYTCTARTHNASGYGAASSSFVLEPEALQAGLPIWLLYEAIKNNQTP